MAGTTAMDATIADRCPMHRSTSPCGPAQLSCCHTTSVAPKFGLLECRQLWALGSMPKINMVAKWQQWYSAGTTAPHLQLPLQPSIVYPSSARAHAIPHVRAVHLISKPRSNQADVSSLSASCNQVSDVLSLLCAAASSDRDCAAHWRTCMMMPTSCQKCNWHAH